MVADRTRTGRALPALRAAGALLAIGCAGCSTLWPRLVGRPSEPVFHSGFPLVGALRTDAALCSLASVGPEAARLVQPPEPLEGAVPIEDACRPGALAAASGGARLVRVEPGDGSGPVHGFLFGGVPRATGLLVAFSGLAMPPDGWINERFAERAARRGLVTFAPVREETARPMWFDPVREARRALDAATRIRTACGLERSPGLAFVGISMGGLEALLANREALRRGMAARAAVLDPVLDVGLATRNLDGYWHSFGVDSMQTYFQRILAGRYGEDPVPTFHDVMERTRTHPEAMTDPAADQPSAWLCGADPDAYAVFLSSTDPVLGDRQRRFGERCGFQFRKKDVPGHTPLACSPKLFDEMLDAAAPPAAPSAEATSRSSP